jgi:hypothetical protein
VGWQPSRFLADCAFVLAEQLGSVNAAAPSWVVPGRRCARPSPATALGSRPQPEAVRQQAIQAARQRSGRPATPALDPVVVALNPGALPAGDWPALARMILAQRSTGLVLAARDYSWANWIATTCQPRLAPPLTCRVNPRPTVV